MTGPARSRRAEITQMAGRSRLFVASYAPLFLILAVRFDSLPLRLACFGIFLVGAGDAWIITHRARTKHLSVEITVTRCEDVGAEVSGYLASYLLPFVTAPNPTSRDLLAYGLFLLVALVVYVRSDLVRVNPSFYLLGYRVLRVTLHSGANRYLLTRREPQLEETIRVVDVAGIVLSVRGSDARG